MTLMFPLASLKHGCIKSILNIQDLLSYGEKKEKRQKIEENEAECVETVFFCYNEFLSKC